MKQSTPFVVQAITEVTLNGQWLCNKICSNIENLGNDGFCVLGLVADNHSANVDVFTSLKYLFHSESKLFFQHSANHGKRTYLFFDTVDLIKNIQNNLLNAKKFIFPNFLTIKLTSNYTVLKVISTGQICITSLTRTKS